MPTTIKNILEKFDLRIDKIIRWNSNQGSSIHGVYIISLSDDINFYPKNNLCNLNEEQLNIWQSNTPYMLLNGYKPSKETLIKHLNKFWLPDESILYIGKAEKQTLKKRLAQYFRHKVGKRSPHKGGYWLKLLNNISDLHIHLIHTNNSHELEEEILNYFIENVSEQTKKLLLDTNLCLPFANLQLRSGVKKKHGLQNHYN